MRTKSYGFFAYWVLFFIVFASSAVLADDKLTADLAQRSRSIISVDGRFEQHKMIEVLPKPIVSNGTFHFKRDEGVIWETLQPIHNRLRITSEGIFSGQNKKLNEQRNAGSAAAANIFMSVVAGELKSLSQYFSVQSKGNVSDWCLQLEPITASLAAYIRSIDVCGTEFTEQLKIDEANGDTTLIHFSTDEVKRDKP